MKKTLRQALPNYAGAFREIESEMRRKVAEIVKERILPTGVVFLQKPFDDVTLLQRLRSLLDGEEPGATTSPPSQERPLDA